MHNKTYFIVILVFSAVMGAIEFSLQIVLPQARAESYAEYIAPRIGVEAEALRGAFFELLWKNVWRDAFFSAAPYAILFMFIVSLLASRRLL